MSDVWDYIDMLTNDALEEEAYQREKDRELEEAYARRPPLILDDGTCERCGLDCHLPPPMGGCFCA